MKGRRVAPHHPWIIIRSLLIRPWVGAVYITTTQASVFCTYRSTILAHRSIRNSTTLTHRATQTKLLTHYFFCCFNFTYARKRMENFIGFRESSGSQKPPRAKLKFIVVWVYQGSPVDVRKISRGLGYTSGVSPKCPSHM